MNDPIAPLLHFTQGWLNSRAAQWIEGFIVLAMIGLLARRNRTFRSGLKGCLLLLGAMLLIAAGGYFLILGIIHAACSVIMGDRQTFP